MEGGANGRPRLGVKQFVEENFTPAQRKGLQKTILETKIQQETYYSTYCGEGFSWQLIAVERRDGRVELGYAG